MIKTGFGLLGMRERINSLGGELTIQTQPQQGMSIICNYSIKMKNRIKVILVDDHAVVRAGFRMLLSTEDTIEVIAEAERGEASLSAVSGKTAGCDGDWIYPCPASVDWKAYGVFAIVTVMPKYWFLVCMMKEFMWIEP